MHEKVRRQRRHGRDGERAPQEQKKKTAAEEMTDQLLGEIDERKNFLQQMAALGGHDRQSEAVINGEISQRVRDLNILAKRGDGK